MASFRRSKELAALATGLHVLRAQLNSHFLCPVCLRAIPLHETRSITAAHIVPRSAKGKATTFLCKRCNNTFGSSQDKWFGERMRLVNSAGRTILDTTIKDPFFWVDDIKVNGEWRRRQDGNFDYIIHQDRNPPSVNQLIADKFKEKPKSLTIRMNLPLLREQRMTEVGFLTAAYLTWFKGLGYSWALQSHLDPVRRQIQRPMEQEIRGRFVAYLNEGRWQHPWIGLARISEEWAVVYGLENALVIFPPMDRPDLYSRLGEDLSEAVATSFLPFSFLRNPIYAEPVCVGIDNRLMIGADPIIRNMAIRAALIHVSSDSGRCEALWPVDEGEYSRLAQQPNVVFKRIDVRHREFFEGQ